MEKRMYFLVPYQLSGRQGCIQAGHSALEYALKYGRHNPNAEVWDFIENHKTWYVLNGGTTNEGSNILVGYTGSMNEDKKLLDEINYPYATFNEPDLGDLMTCVCLICDERVFNRDDYPDFSFMNFNQWARNVVSDAAKELYEKAKAEAYEKWTLEVGKDIAVLKSILNTKRFF